VLLAANLLVADDKDVVDDIARGRVFEIESSHDSFLTSKSEN